MAKADEGRWAWVEGVEGIEGITRENIEITYSIHSHCQGDVCKKNDRWNPNCCHHLGERNWQEEPDSKKSRAAVALETKITSSLGPDPSEKKRKKDEPIGLTNLGSTCYVNSILQMKFHINEFRKGVYSWQPEPGIGALEKSVCYQLQRVFSFMQCSDWSVYNPCDFIQSLGLETQQQQDAQEFYRLFMSLLEDILLDKDAGPDGKPIRIINKLFQGNLLYETTCNTCGYRSQRKESYYELPLNVKGNPTLQKAFEELVRPEELKGDNQYYCERCSSKQNATRTTFIESLPC
eukprot:Ihof_evm1s686 gene=Ihof_evmTU1s686